jgi:hypothetical protein
MTRSSYSKSYRVGVLALAILAVGVSQPWRLLAQAPEPAKGVKYAQISPDDMKEWLSYLASDELQGRQIFTEGYGAAAQYVADHLKQWGVKPIGDDKTYFQYVKLKDYKITRNSTVTVTVNGESKTFKHGDHVTFASNSGGKQTLNFGSAYFAGYATQADLEGKPVKDGFVVSVPNGAPPAGGGTGPGGNFVAAGGGGRGGRGGARGGGGYAINTLGAKAAVGYVAAPAPPTPAEEALAKALASLTDASAAVTAAQAAERGRGAGGGAGAGGGRGGGGGGGRAAVSDACTPPACDTRTVQRIDGVVAPQFTADDTFYDFLFSGSPMKFADVKAKAAKGEALPGMPLAAKVTVNIDNTYDVVKMQVSKNVVGMIEGSDPKLKDTYIMIGAHLDHIGYSQTGGGRGAAPNGCRRRSEVSAAAVVKAGKVVQNPVAARGGGAGRGAAAAPGAPTLTVTGAAGAAAAGAAAAGAAGQAQAAAGGGRGAAGGGGRGGAAAGTPTLPLEQRDFISNGADDDGSGSTSMLAVAKAFATGPKPKRSIVFVWHTGEEAGLYGSHYNADFPVVPLEKVQAQLNMDMVGRDDCNNVEGDYTNTLFLVGADRISTDLHNIIVQTNQTLAKPLTLDYELNDVADPESVYTRSDHYSYAQKGIPIAFFTTGLHPDYHRVTDTWDKITYPKMARIAQLVYETGFSIANTDRVLTRDNKGPQTGFGSKAEIIKK